MTDNTSKWRIYSRLYLLAGMAIMSFALAISLFTNERIDKAVMFNTGIDVMGLFVCVALYFGCIDDDRADSEHSTNWLMALIFLLGFCFLNNELNWYLRGVQEYSQLYLFLNILAEAYDFVLVYFYYNYVRRLLNFKGKLAKWLDKYNIILMIPFIMLTLANAFVPINLALDEQGIIMTLPLYHLLDLDMIIVMPLTIILLLRSDGSTKHKIVALSFIITPIVHYILSGGAHNYATQYGSTLFAVTQIYGVLFSDSNRKLASTKTELDMAAKIQKSILPENLPAALKHDGFDIHASMEPAREVGGDFYDYFLVDDDHLCIVMADVSGKGVPGALYMMISKIIIKNSMMLGESPAVTLRTLNKAICSNNREDMFVTVWIGLLEISSGKITAVNAGHEYPIICKNNGNYELFKDRHYMVVGAFRETDYQEYEIKMSKGDKIFLYTDGIPEATNKNKKQYGLNRLVNTLNEVNEADPEETLVHVRESVYGFVRNADQFDDLTMLCLEYKGK